MPFKVILRIAFCIVIYFFDDLAQRYFTARLNNCKNWTLGNGSVCSLLLEDVPRRKILGRICTCISVEVFNQMGLIIISGVVGGIGETATTFGVLANRSKKALKTVYVVE
jgi:hypothetical protein